MNRIADISNDQNSQHKKCSVCNAIKAKDDFYKDSRTPDGRTGTCKVCRNKQSKRWAAVNPIRYYCSTLLTQAKRRIDSRGHEVSADLTVDYLLSIATPNCPITGEPLLWEYSHGNGVNSLSPSLDRIDSSMDYEPGNVRIISHRMNAIKNNLSLHQINALHAYMNGKESADKGGSFADNEATFAQVSKPTGHRSIWADAQKIEEIEKLRNEGKSLRAIASSVGIAKSSVQVILQKISETTGP